MIVGDIEQRIGTAAYLRWYDPDYNRFRDAVEAEFVKSRDDTAFLASMENVNLPIEGSDC